MCMIHMILIFSDEICKELLNSISDAPYPFRFCCLMLAQLLKVCQHNLTWIIPGQEKEKRSLQVLSFSLRRHLLLRDQTAVLRRVVSPRKAWGDEESQALISSAYLWVLAIISEEVNLGFNENLGSKAALSLFSSAFAMNRRQTIIFKCSDVNGSLYWKMGKLSKNHSILPQWVFEMEFWSFFPEEVQFCLFLLFYRFSLLSQQLDNSTVQHRSLRPGLEPGETSLPKSIIYQFRL